MSKARDLNARCIEVLNYLWFPSVGRFRLEDPLHFLREYRPGIVPKNAEQSYWCSIKHYRSILVDIKASVSALGRKSKKPSLRAHSRPLHVLLAWYLKLHRYDSYLGEDV